MEQIKHILEPILEDQNIYNNQNLIDKLYIEIIYFSDTMPHIKSYYIMNEIEYKDLKSLHIDLFIENFLNEENLTKDKLDIHLIQNPNSQNHIINFINLFGNSFDILNFINIKKNKSNSGLLNNNFSDSDSDLSNSLTNELSELIQKPKINIKYDHETDSDSDNYINTITEIIEIYNKTSFIDDIKINKLTTTRPDLLKDNIINELNNSIIS